MLPFPPFEGPVPEFITEPNLENMLDELFSATDAAAPHVCDNRTALPSPNLSPGGIPMLPSSFRHPSQDQQSIRNNVPDRIQNLSTQVAQNPTTLCHIESEVPENLQVDEGHSEVSSLADMVQLEQPDDPLPEPRVNPEFLENRPASEAGRDGKGKVNGKPTNVETHRPLGAAQTEYSGVNLTPCSQHPASEGLPKQLAVTWTRTSGDVASIPYSDNPGCVGNRNILDASLTEILPRSPLFHDRPSNKESERPAKRQRKTKGMASTDFTPSSSRLVSAPSSQIDRFLVHGCIKNDSQSQRGSMPLVDDAAIQRNLMTNDSEYQWKTTTVDSAMKQGATDVRIETGFHNGKETAFEHLIQSAHSPADAFRTPENNASIQSPSGHATKVNSENTLRSRLPRYSPLPAEVIADHSSTGSSRRNTPKPRIINHAETLATGARMNFSSDSRPLRPDLNIINKSTAKPNLPGTAAVDHRSSLETSSLPCNFNATANSPSLSAISGLQLPQVSEPNLDSKEGQYSGEAVIEPLEQIPKELEATIVGSDTHYTIMRLENPPECNVCEKLYITEEDLKKHIKTAHGEPKSEFHKCTECKATFKNDTNLRRHTHEAHASKHFYCNSCGAGFSTKRALVLHEKQLHSVIPTSAQRKKAMRQSCASTSEKKFLIYYECLLCDHASTVKGNLMRHVKGKHLNERPFQCLYCDKRGKTKQNIAFHLPICRGRQIAKAQAAKARAAKAQAAKAQAAKAQAAKAQTAKAQTEKDST